jgi:hypothetical protein
VPNAFVYSAANPAARKHFRDTVENGLSLDDVLPFIEPAERGSLRAQYPDGSAYLWAGHSGGQDEIYWNMMRPGDLVLGYRDWALICASDFVGKARGTELGLMAWPDATDRPYDLIYFLSKPVFFNRRVAEFPQYFGEMYQGLRRISGSEAILRDYGDLRYFRDHALLESPNADSGLRDEQNAAKSEGVFDPKSAIDARKRQLRAIVVRRGSDKFRGELLRAYNGCCAVTGFNAPDALEAAHIRPYLGEATDHVQNGLLLRCDIHTLFDLERLRIDPDTLNVVLAPQLRRTDYGDLDGLKIIVPADPKERPSREALRMRWNGEV